MKIFRHQLSFLFALACGLALRAQTTPLSGGTGVATDATITFTDITTNNASVSKHGFLPKLSGSASDVLKGDGTFGAGGVGTVTSTSFTGGLISVATATTTPAFTVAGTSGGVPYFASASTWASSGALAANSLLIGGGAGAAPASTTTASGLLTFFGTPSSANLATVVSDETGTGALVFANTPTLVTPNIGAATGTSLVLTGNLTTGSGGSVAGGIQMGQGTLPALGTTAATWSAPASVTSHNVLVPAAVGSTGLMQWSVSGTTATISSVTAAPSGMTATTQSAGDNSTKIATTQYTDRAALTVPNAQTGTTYTLVAADGVASTAGVTMNNASANTLTIPANASVAFAIGTMIPVTQLGAGATTIAITSDTLNSNGNLLTVPGQYCTVVLHKIGATTWNAYGTGPVVTYPTTTAINTLLYASAANVESALATANSGVLITSSGGVPSIASTLPSGLTIPAPVFSTGATASGSGNFDLSGSSGTFKTQTGAATIGPGAVGITGALTITGPAATTALTLTQTARTSGILPYIKYTIPTDTAQTAATESPGIQGVTGTRTWATTGTVALQREIFFPGPTYASASASQTFTDAFNMYLTPPVAGSNAIFTRGHTLGIVDATSAASSITGGLVVSAAVGTTATSTGIGNGNINTGGTLTVGGTSTLTGAVTQTAKTATYNNVATAGWGLPALYAAPAISATKTANFTAITFAPAAAAGVYRIDGVITTTSATNTGTVQFTVDYVDSQGTTHTADVIPLLDAAGTVAATKTGASKEFMMISRMITVNNSATNILVKVVITGTVSYTVEATVEQLN